MKKPVLIAAGVAVVALAGTLLLKKDDEASVAAAAGSALVAVKVPALGDEALKGEALFNDNCASCHGKNAAGRDGNGPPLVHKIYEPNHHADGSFYLAAMRGVRAHHWPFGDMPPVEGIREDQVASIVTYVRTLQRENGIF
ncbi:cytochrome c [uncultured Roseibium sp.]|uniref:c-type cytochrome n=1 Tax=uncultured Roseibium sp. TaxID=1936171 RepID=UPI0032169EA5